MGRGSLTDRVPSDPRSGFRVLVVGVNYAPEQSGNAPYTSGLAEHLASRGHDVTVVTGMPHYPSWHVSPEYAGRWRAQEQRDGVLVRRHAIYVPPRQSALRRAAYEASFVVSAGPIGGIGRPDIVIGVTPILGGAVLARLFGARWHAPYGVIVQDLTGAAAAQSGIAGGTRVAHFARNLEWWALSKATAIAAVSRGFFPYLRELGIPRRRLVYLPNWTHIALPRADRAATRARLGWDDGRLVVLHAGNMGLKQDLDQVVRAAALATSLGEPVRFVLLGDGSQRKTLQEQARGIANIEFLDPIPEDEFPEVLAAADVLLVAERASVQNMSLPSKLTSYAAAGRPVIAAVRPDGVTAAVVREAGLGIIAPAGNPQALLDGLRSLSEDAALRDRLAANGRHYAAAGLDRQDARDRIDQFIERIGRKERVPLPARVDTT